MKKTLLAALAALMMVMPAFAAQPYATPPIGKAPGDRCTALGGVSTPVAGNYYCCRAGYRIRPDGSFKMEGGKKLPCPA